MSTDPIAIARRLAAASPTARLPCPVCAASLDAENLARHLAKVHAGATASAAVRWRGKGFLGLFPCSVGFDGDQLTLRHRLGLATRVVRLPCAIEVGALFGTRVDPITSSYADDANQPTRTVRLGRYVRLVGERSITIGCRHNTQFTSHWDRAGWRDGARRRSTDLVVDREAMVAIEYELARRGVLVPAATSP